MLRIVFPKLAMETLQRGFAAVKNPGRLEVVARKPRVILSGDHNPAGLESTIRSLGEIPTGKLYTVCAFSHDKPFREMFAKLEAISEDILLTRLDKLRGPLPEDYGAGCPYEPDANRAIDSMLAKAGPDDTILITGSLYLVGQVRARWTNQVSYRHQDPR